MATLSRKLFWNLSLLLLVGLLFINTSSMVQAQEAEFDQAAVGYNSVIF